MFALADSRLFTTSEGFLVYVMESVQTFYFILFYFNKRKKKKEREDDKNI